MQVLCGQNIKKKQAKLQKAIPKRTKIKKYLPLECYPHNPFHNVAKKN